MAHIFKWLAEAGITLVSGLFVLGLLGCIAVLVLTFWEDVKTIVER